MILFLIYSEGETEPQGDAVQEFTLDEWKALQLQKEKVKSSIHRSFYVEALHYQIFRTLLSPSLTLENRAMERTRLSGRS